MGLQFAEADAAGPGKRERVEQLVRALPRRARVLGRGGGLERGVLGGVLGVLGGLERAPHGLRRVAEARDEAQDERGGPRDARGDAERRGVARGGADAEGEDEMDDAERLEAQLDRLYVRDRSHTHTHVCVFGGYSHSSIVCCTGSHTRVFRLLLSRCDETRS